MRFAVKVGIAWIDPAKIRQQRDQPAVSLVYPVSDPMHFGNVVPREHIAGREFVKIEHKLILCPPMCYTKSGLDDQTSYRKTLENLAQVGTTADRAADASHLHGLGRGDRCK